MIQNLKTFIASDKILQRETSAEYRRACKGDIIAKVRLYAKAYEIMKNYSNKATSAEDKTNIEELIHTQFSPDKITQLSEAISMHEYFAAISLPSSRLHYEITSFYRTIKNIDELNDYVYGGGNIKSPEDIEREDFTDTERYVEGVY